MVQTGMGIDDDNNICYDEDGYDVRRGTVAPENVVADNTDNINKNVDADVFQYEIPEHDVQLSGSGNVATGVTSIYRRERNLYTRSAKIENENQF